MNSQPYPHCVYCAIVAGTIPCAKVYEDDQFLAFLDIHPATKGHTLLIPKVHTRWVHDVEPFETYWSLARCIARSQDTHLNPTYIQYFTHGALDHAHIHIIPRYDGIDTADPILIQPTHVEDGAVLNETAGKIKI